jgi:hypothetical protein
MTISICIRNTDTRREAIVAVKIQTPAGEPIAGCPDTELKGGDEATKYVHSGQRLVVEEVKNG